MNFEFIYYIDELEKSFDHFYPKKSTYFVIKILKLSYYVVLN